MPTKEKEVSTKKSRPRKASRRSRFRAFPLILSLVVLGTIGAIAWAFLPASSDPKSVKVEIPNESSGKDIAALLRQKGIIRSETAFLIMSRILDETANLQAGDYNVSPSMSLVQIINVLAQGQSGDMTLARWITIPEGYTLKQIAQAFGNKNLADPRRFERIARVGGKSFKGLSFTPPQNLEGLLFPDTYKMPVNATERELIERMLKTFDEKVYKPHKEEFQKARQEGRSVQEVVILASMVEREAVKKEEQPKIAGVIMNRIKEGMRLQIDATVQYALAAPKRRLLKRDLKVESPYNTYLIDGMPPGPICSPGLDAIKAALNPDTHDYLYYVAKPDGFHIFTKSNDDHNDARRKARELAGEES